MLPDEPVELRPGITVRSYSIDDLRSQCPFRHLSNREIADRLASTGADSPTWPFRNVFCSLGILFAQRLWIPLTSPALDDALRRRVPHELDTKSDGELIELMIREGELFALGAYWGVSEEYWLLWAAAAALLEHLGYEHPNDIR